jgi:hypothetical protein
MKPAPALRLRSVEDQARQVSPGTFFRGRVANGARGVASGQVCFITQPPSSDGRSMATLVDGSRLPLAIGFAKAKKQKEDEGDLDWVQTAKLTIANLRHLVEVKDLPRGEHALVFAGGGTTVLRSGFAEQVRERLQAPTLDHVTPFPRWRQLLRDMNIRTFEKPLLEMTDDELGAAFGDASGRLDLRAFTGNYIWQLASRLLAGLPIGQQGTYIRSLWYRIWPRLARYTDGDVDSDYVYQALCRQMSIMVAGGVFPYSLFKFRTKVSYRVGKVRPELIFVAEKDDHYAAISRMSRGCGVSLIALGGGPSALATECFFRDLKKSVTDYYKPGRVSVITMTDWDPSGVVIARSFVENLEALNIRRVRHVPLFNPLIFSQAERDDYKIPLRGKTASERTKIREWFKATGGVDGKPFRLETDAFLLDSRRARKVFLDAYNLCLAGGFPRRTRG